MDYTINRIFVPLSTLVTTGDTSALTLQEIGFYNPNTFQALAAYNVDQLLVAFGSGVDTWGSFKSSTIKKTNVINFTKSVANTASQQQITWIGWDGVNASTAPTFKCDEEYIITFLIREYYSRGIFQPLIRESVRIKTSCCNECSSNCDALDCKDFMQSAVDQINNNPLLSKYLVAEAVTDCTGGSEGYTTYTLTVPTPDDEGDYELALLEFYGNCIAEGGISYVTGDENTTFTVIPATGCGRETFDVYEGVEWEEVYVAGSQTCKCGIKVTGAALDEFGTPCIPDAVPYVANLVRFHAVVHEGPYNTQDFDIENECGAWNIITTQNVAYSIGDSSAMAERERHYFRYNLPGNVYQAGYYWNPVYNNDTKLYSNPTATYTVYRIEYYINEPKGFEKKFPYTEAVEIWVDSTNAVLATAIELALETFTGILV
jgi:hypothetical protein